jgi:putative flippase GtrA
MKELARTALDRLAEAWRERAVALKALSFGMVGLVNTAVDAVLFFLAIHFLTSSLVVANVLSWLVAVSGSYVMNSFTTFAAESGGRLRLRSYATFVASGIAGVIANTTALLIAAQFFSVYVAKAIAILVSFVVNFTFAHFVVFRARPASDAQ